MSAPFPSIFMVGRIFESNDETILASVFESFETFMVLHLVFADQAAARRFGRASLEIGEMTFEWMLAIGGGGPIGRELAVVFSGALEARQPTFMHLVEEGGQRHELPLSFVYAP